MLLLLQWTFSLPSPSFKKNELIVSELFWRLLINEKIIFCRSTVVEEHHDLINSQAKQTCMHSHVHTCTNRIREPKEKQQLVVGNFAARGRGERRKKRGMNKENCMAHQKDGRPSAAWRSVLVISDLPLPTIHPPSIHPPLQLSGVGCYARSPTPALKARS